MPTVRDLIEEKLERMTAASVRAELLDEAKDIVTADRNTQYGTPEENFQRIAKYWSIHLDYEIRPHDVAIMLMLVKAARISASPDKWDHWVDLAGYASCGAEVRPRPPESQA